MSETITKNKEGILLNILNAISPLEWGKFKSKYTKVIVNKEYERVDDSCHPPYIVFRFETESKNVIERVKLLILRYKGAIKWELHEHKRDGLLGTNWVIRPLRFNEVESLANEENLSVSDYLAKFEPEFGPVAFDDLNGLTKYIEENLHN